MALLDMYQRKAQRLREDIARLQMDKARVQKKLADLSGRTQRAQESMRRTKSASTIQSKTREIERYRLARKAKYGS
jgi:hypothetical protein